MDRLGHGDELSNSLPVPSETESLLKKYDIPIDHLDFKYVEECQNGKELEKIFHILQSGQEGYYPDLMKCAEKKLREIYPNSKRLRKTVKVLMKNDIDNKEWQNLNCDVEDWVKNINKNDAELLSFKNTKDDYSQVPIRDSNSIHKTSKKKTARIKSMDYSQWDKLDVDAEMLKMDLEEEKQKREIEKAMEQKEKINTVVIKPDYMTEAELKHSALQEKDRGNEFYKEGDYEEALGYYTNSLNFQPTVAAFNNRAVTYIKLNQFENAINDCNEVLKLEPLNLKALLRKALSYKSLEEYDQAAECLQKLIELDPNDSTAQNMMKVISDKLQKNKPTKTVRICIKDEKSHSPKKPENNNNSKKPKNVLVPIPGTSCDKPPFYKVLNVTDEVEEKYKKSCVMTSHPSDENVVNLNEYENTKLETEKPKIKKEKVSPINDNTRRNDAKVKKIKNEENITNIQMNKVEMLENKENGITGSNCNKNGKVDEKTKDDNGMKIDNNKKDFDNNNDIKASGEPCSIHFEEISPYGFIKYWQMIKNDKSLRILEKILRSIEPTELAKVIGNKLDGDMLGLILECLKRHFNKPEDAILLVNLLEHFSRLPRFNIISMLLNHREKVIARDILNFVSSCGQQVSSELINKLM